MSDEQTGDQPVAQTNPTSTKTVDRLKCPECGGTHFHVEKGLVLWCLSCGRTATPWAYQDKAHAELAKAYAKASGAVVPGRRIHKDSPACQSKKMLANGDQADCGSQDWQHDGERLLYCRVCGTNFTGEQPKNVKEIIDTLGPAAPKMRTPQTLSRKSPEEFGDGATRTKPGVDLEEYRAHQD